MRTGEICGAAMNSFFGFEKIKEGRKKRSNQQGRIGNKILGRKYIVKIDKRG